MALGGPAASARVRPAFGAALQPLGVPGVAELKPLSRYEALRLGPGWSHSCYALLFAPQPGRLFGRLPLRFAVLMQLRFDGQLGFPGGFVDRRLWSLEDGLNRVLGLGLGGVRLTDANYLSSHLAAGTQRVVAHLYVKQLTLQELHAVEISAVHSRDHGLEVGGSGSNKGHSPPSCLQIAAAWAAACTTPDPEVTLQQQQQQQQQHYPGFLSPYKVMGTVRVPLYTQKDRLGGLPSFLGNSFVSTAKFQLLYALKVLHMVPVEKLVEAVAATQKPQKALPEASLTPTAAPAAAPEPASREDAMLKA